MLRRFPTADIPKSEEELSDWLINLYHEKVSCYYSLPTSLSLPLPHSLPLSLILPSFSLPLPLSLPLSLSPYLSLPLPLSLYPYLSLPLHLPLPLPLSLYPYLSLPLPLSLPLHPLSILPSLYLSLPIILPHHPPLSLSLSTNFSLISLSVSIPPSLPSSHSPLPLFPFLLPPTHSLNHFVIPS